VSLSLSDVPRTTSDHAAALSPTSATASSRRPGRKTATVLGDPDQPHTYTYIPDIGQGLAVLGEHSNAPGQVWHLPNDPTTHTTRQLVDLVFQQAGQSRTRLRQVKPLLIRVAAQPHPT
jgi:nucleoside-diphosphate-sugar epimerase